MKIGLFYGTNTGNTETVAELLAQKMEAVGFEVDVHDMASASVSDFDNYENIIMACPTWNDGELQDDWDAVMPDLEAYNFAGKKVGFLGLGDADGYPDNFVDALGTLAAPVKATGGTIFGLWSTDGYTYDTSRGLEGDKFLGLVIDQDNQEDLTEERIEKWVAQIKSEL
jgi:flavodoxin I